ncbi:MAG: serine hydrolase [Saprospiraceae bacterium]|nr:serine hydrolase [Saprospiraceae bacterium]
MKIRLRYKCLFISCFITVLTSAQKMYFPPVDGDEWETTEPEALGWCTEKIPDLLDFLDEKNTKAFIVLKDGKIVIEAYFDQFNKDKLWYWASAGKTVTAFSVGMAVAEGFIDLEESTSTYLGEGWTSLRKEDESKIRVIHQLTMTTGLDDKEGDPYCTEPQCLVYKADPGERWAYHNAPYTLLDAVIENATGKNLNGFIDDRLKMPTGMKGLFIKNGYNNVYWSDPRSMARFGLLVLNDGTWADQPILEHQDYIRDMRNPSQHLNPSYGYLWWLNGQDKFLLPGLQIPFNGSWSPSAPADLYAGLGKNGQFLDIVPGENLIIVRMGEAPDNSLVPVIFHDQMWERLNEVICTTTTTRGIDEKEEETVWPNPVRSVLQLPHLPNDDFVSIFNSQGIINQFTVLNEQSIDVDGIDPGTYFVRYKDDNGYLRVYKFVKI